jgi:hypothetical protein
MSVTSITARPAVLSAAADPHTIYRYGRLATQVAAAEALLASAAATLEEVTRFPGDAAAWDGSGTAGVVTAARG